MAMPFFPVEVVQLTSVTPRLSLAVPRSDMEELLVSTIEEAGERMVK